MFSKERRSLSVGIKAGAAVRPGIVGSNLYSITIVSYSTVLAKLSVNIIPLSLTLVMLH